LKKVGGDFPKFWGVEMNIEELKKIREFKRR
jgi:hypothetical protein